MILNRSFAGVIMPEYTVTVAFTDVEAKNSREAIEKVKDALNKQEFSWLLVDWESDNETLD